MIRRLQWFLLACCLYVVPLSAQGGGSLESRVSALERRFDHPVVDIGGVAFLTAAFCAFWAQHTGRRGWLWFLMGLLFSPITVIVLLVKNGRELEERRLTAHLRR